ncbi:protocadherin-8 [Pangasianodon hypophthalmus]|uniref:protocadherin-8 n=1 Tax=Pangasianodon hypophthalmus TaxID=310915 RepID=UPI00147BEC08|nr:protocadherin-8 [Pangasianodon hypophthalmus]
MQIKKLLLSFSLVVIFAAWTVKGTTTKYYTYEEDAPGTFIGNLSTDLKLNLSEDPHTSFRFMQEGNTSLIRMRKSDGLLTVGARIDRESLCGSSTQCMITADVVVFSKEKFHLIHVEIHVRDINDHAPVFPRGETWLEISENAAVDSRFSIEVATDLDVGNNYIQSYQLINSSHFGIEVGTGEDGKKFAQLVLAQKLDRELEDSYTLQVIASDGGSPPKSGAVTVRVKVLDSNDNSPQFEHDTIRVELHEDAPVGFLLLRVQAFDPDHGENGDVRYDFAEGESGEIKSTFDVDPVSGAVTLKSSVDFEARTSYELHIRAYDLGANSVPSTCTVTVEIVDVNDNAPEVTIKPMASRSGDMAYITEAAAVESFVALVSAADRDSGANGYVRVSLHGHAHFRLQQAYGDTLMIVTTSVLDREKIPEYNLTVIAEDLGSPPFKTFTQYTIRVSDENDNAPSFSKPVFEISVMENKAAGSYVASLVARDPDEGANGKVTYKLLENEVEGVPVSSFLSVDSATGTLYTVRPLDYEHVKQIEVAIQATDGGSPPLSSTALVKVKVVDENDNTPFFVHPILINGSADIPLPCNAPAGYVALKLEGRDNDDAMNAELSYTIMEDEAFLFVVNENTGEMALKHDLALVFGDTVHVRVAVSDHGRTPLFHTASIRFVVSDAMPLEEQVVVVLEASQKQDKPIFDASFIIIGLLGAACAVLLVAIVAVAFSRRNFQRNVSSISKISGGNFRKTQLPTDSIDSTDSNSLSGGSVTVTEQISSSRDESSFSFEDEQSRDSDSKMFRPLLTKGHFEPVSLWQGDRYTLQMSEIGSVDQTSMRDSGKGDSDSNDSDSDSGQAGQKIANIGHQRASSSLYTAPMDGAGACRTREIPTHTTSTHVGNSGYTVAYRTLGYGRHPAAANQGPSFRDYSYNAVFSQTKDYPHVPVFHRMGTQPQYYYQHHVHRQLDKQAVPPREPITDIISMPVASF